MLAANNITLLEPNVLYLDEKPPTIVKRKKSTVANRTKKKQIKKTITKIKKNSRTAKIQQKYIVKEEISTTGNNGNEEEMVYPNDPLYMSQVEIKIEQNVDKLLSASKFDEYNVKQNYETDKLDEYLEDEDELSDNDDEDEPLIQLTRDKGQPCKYIKMKEYNKIKAPRSVKCLLLCKRHCNEKFTEEQRKRICAYFWSLSKEDRLVFLRKHIKSKYLKRYKRIRVNKRCYNYCYYLKDYTKDNANDDTCNVITDLLRVCRKYFEATLNINNHYLKKALTGCKLEVEKGLEELVETIKAIKEKEKKESQEIKYVLDSETGNLITVDPMEKNNKSKTSSELKPKKKRRKPNDPIPEHSPKPITCSVRCIYKCHTKFTEQERKQMCDIFWSMDYKHRKNYILANVEVKQTETQRAAEFRSSNRTPRTHQTHFFLRTGLQGDKKRVCKHFMTNTLCTGRKFISNAIEYADKTTGYYAGADKRIAGKKISDDRLKAILDHIRSYPTWVPNKKSKTKYLHHTLNIKKMYEEYKQKCQKENMKAVSTENFYKSFHDNFCLLFLLNPDPKKRGGFINKNPNISHYTGEEPGGFWLDSNGERLDIRLFNPAQSMLLHYQQLNSSIFSNTTQNFFSNVYPSTTLQLNPLNYTTATAAAHQVANMIDPSIAARSSLNTRTFNQPSLFGLELNSNLK